MTVQVISFVAAAPARVFDLKLDVDVHAASQHAAGETAATRDGRRQLTLGDEVTFQARHFGIRWRMTSRITAYQRPDEPADAVGSPRTSGRFVDEQVRGPFAMMRHEHLFEADGAGTRMTDRMSFAAPFGPLGAVVARLVLAPHLRRLLTRRAAHLDALVRAGG
ncbi:SRPBCC family protein [Actinoplanes sichuanensis]|uniref:SRPBCC family protein n=1 Tax=Actinoplanes sichuanensis TaxID=512349 RepID=UPI003670F529